MSTHHHLSMDPTNHNSAATSSSPLVSSSVQQLLTETSNGQSPLTYPPASAHYDDLVHTPDLFWAKLKAFHKSFATKFVIPTVGGRALDLHRLFVEVTSRGGLEKIIRDRKWKEVIAVFNFPTTITSASFVLRKYYLSLLYHFEQVYYFQKQVPPISMPDSLGRSLVNGSAILEEGAIQAPGPRLQIGCSVLGTIDAKFDNGYMVTVDLGSSQLKGVIYHTPPILHMSQSQRSQTPAMASRRSRKRSRLALRDPTHPKSNRSGYNFFFAEHYTKLKPQYYGQERAIGKKIGLLWNNLTEAEKEVYQEKGVRDKERYKSEMLEFRTS